MPPTFDDDPGLFESVEYLAVEKFVPSFELKLSQYPFSHGLPVMM
jgi:hypothetical protein